MKVNELEGAKLDYWVAKAEELNPILHKKGKAPNGGEVYIEHVSCLGKLIYSPSVTWAEGGPIIEREGISAERLSNGEWHAETSSYLFFGRGPTMLIASMRCYLASKFWTAFFCDDCCCWMYGINVNINDSYKLNDS